VRVISFEGVSKRYGAHQALQNVGFTVPKGQVLGLLGQNGAGKTTAMNILTGCLAPSAGRVTVGGFDVLTQPRQARRMIGYLPENAPLYDEMTVRAYLRFACELKEVEKRAIGPHLEAVAEKTGLTGVLDRKCGNLSKGYRQRVGIAQALCGTPEAIILDEPTAGLDPRQSSDVRKLVRELAGEHTVLFSSHILSEVQSVCDRVIILHHGKIICDSALQTLRCGEERLRAVIACGEGTLLPALRQLNSVSRVEVERGGEPGITQAVLTVKGGGPAERELFTLLSGMQAPLLRLYPVEDSLEDIFLRATMDEGTAG
jgi:ABC-2 type transport system ATP-binding protein